MTMFKGKILLPAPAWTTYNPQVITFVFIEIFYDNINLQAKLAGHTPLPIQTSEKNKWKLTREDLRSAVAGQQGPWLLILTNPGNPSGCVYQREELEGISEVCREHKIIVMRFKKKFILNHGCNQLC